MALPPSWDFEEDCQIKKCGHCVGSTWTACDDRQCVVQKLINGEGRITELALLLRFDIGGEIGCLSPRKIHIRHDGMRGQQKKRKPGLVEIGFIRDR